VAVPAKEFIPPLGKNPFIRGTIEDLKTELLKMSDPTIPEPQLLRQLHSTDNQKNFIDAMQFAYGVLFLASLWDRVVVDEPVLEGASGPGDAGAVWSGPARICPARFPYRSE